MLQTPPHDGFNKKIKMHATNNQKQKQHCQDITTRVKKMQINLPQAGNSFEYVDKSVTSMSEVGYGQEAGVGVKTNAHRVLVGKYEGTAWKILGTGKDYIKMNLKERVWVMVELIHVAQNKYMLRAAVNTIISLTFPQNAQSFLTR
jgi:hypothetical protein